MLSYWPSCLHGSESISLTTLVIIEWLGNFTELSRVMKAKKYSPFLNYELSSEFARGLLVHAYFYSHYHKIFNDLDQFSFRYLSPDQHQIIHQKLLLAQNKILPLFDRLYSACLKDHPHPKIIYERGLVNFHQGDYFASFEDIRQLISYAEENNYEELLTSDLYFQEGRLLNEMHSYDEAILCLTKAIQKDPKNKEAYFERAIAYFETGNISLAVSDYKKSDIKPTQLNKKDLLHFFEFSKGMVSGLFKGGIDSSLNFVPSLLASTWGIGKGLWGMMSHPIEVSKEFIEACNTCLEFLKTKEIIEIVENLIPEIQEYIRNSMQISEQEKGYLIGYIIGHYGIDIFAWGCVAKAIRIFHDLRRTNTVMTLEYAARSFKNEKEVAEAASKYFEAREVYKKKCNLHIGQQEKHIPGANNFKEGRGELTISIEKLEELANQRLGTGVPTRASFGEAGYRETVDFGEIIGIHVYDKTGERFPTSIGDIHYNKDGGYHVVPVNPNKLQRLTKK